MSDSTATSDTKKQLPERNKIKKKMSKAQMQLAIIKKKQCDAKALVIVEQLLEPNVNAEWLLENMRYISKSHMEDVIEERAITKLCGYALCNKSLTVVITQQYHISTRKNKVYDVTRRKNFCSSRCYGACSYLLEQLLTSPLWLRETEEIPIFKLLPTQDEIARSTPGDEIQVQGNDILLNADDDDKNCNTMKQIMKSTPCISNELGNPNNKKSNVLDKRKTNDEEFEGKDDISEIYIEKNALNYSDKHSINIADISNDKNKNDNIEDINTDLKIKETLVLDECIQSNNIETNNVELLSNKCDLNKTVDCSTEQMLENIKKVVDDKISNIQNNSITDKKQELEHNKECSNVKKEKKVNQEKHCTVNNNNKKKDHDSVQTSKFYTLAIRVEKSIKEWFTDDTLCLLVGEEDAKRQLFENIAQHDRYLQLCKKLNKLQLEDENEDRTDLDQDTMKPLPHYSILKEEGKKLELKVRAFYQGNMVLETPKNISENIDKQDNSNVIPLTDAHAPKSIRRRIFLDKLNKILPDLLRTLSGGNQSQYTYTSEKSGLIKVLVNTFSLSSTNIIFKSTEWTLVGLAIIKMLSVIDLQLKILLATKQASMYISMILMSYKLDSNYLDRLIIELTNNTKIFDHKIN